MVRIHACGRIVVRIISVTGTHRFICGFSTVLLNLKDLLLVGLRLLVDVFLVLPGRNSVSMLCRGLVATNIAHSFVV
jgi:hypothetical protein